MLLALVALLHCCDSAPTYSGREHQLDVRIPRVEGDVVIDGDLADSVWAHAALLTGFSQYAPTAASPPRTSPRSPSCTHPRPAHSAIGAFGRTADPPDTLGTGPRASGPDP